MAKLYFNYSTMNAGKTTVLLQAAHNYSERGMKPFLLLRAHVAGLAGGRQRMIMHAAVAMERISLPDRHKLPSSSFYVDQSLLPSRAILPFLVSLHDSSAFARRQPCLLLGRPDTLVASHRMLVSKHDHPETPTPLAVPPSES